MSIYIILLIAISLSMDAFSLSLAYGTLNIDKFSIYILSIIVGIYHFIMPILGKIVGNTIFTFIKVNPNVIVMIVLSIIGLQMIYDSLKEEKQVKKLSKIEMLIFGFAVSIDAFSVGIGINLISSNYFICSLLFSISSFIFTLLGLNLGKKINKIFGHVSTLIGGIVLIIIGISYVA